MIFTEDLSGSFSVYQYGGGNGYFTGDIFSVKGSNYHPSKYFAVSM